VAAHRQVEQMTAEVHPNLGAARARDMRPAVVPKERTLAVVPKERTLVAAPETPGVDRKQQSIPEARPAVGRPVKVALQAGPLLFHLVAVRLPAYLIRVELLDRIDLASSLSRGPP